MMPQTIERTAAIQRFGQQGEKTGWTYVAVPAEWAQQLHPADKTSFRVNGSIDDCPLQSVSLIPMGEGDYIIPLNAAMRRIIRKPVGASVSLRLSKDEKGYQLVADFVACLDDDPDAAAFFKTLTGSHQRYFSKWIDSAKTQATRDKRIAQAIMALGKKMGYPEMIRANTGKAM